MDEACSVLHQVVAKDSSCLPFSESGFKRETDSQLLPHLHHLYFCPQDILISSHSG